jgi:Vault protein inter-alpha-trypsin domain/von Willebrand factor type A domain
MAQPSSETPLTQGILRTADGLPLPLERTSVEASIIGPIAEVQVRQVFHNDLDRAIEAVYLFPLPHEAAVHTLTFRLRGRLIEGAVKAREDALRDYEKARAEGRAATLLEQDTPSLFTMSIANVAPGERVEVVLGYQERLAFDDGEYRFVFPMVAAERHEGASASERRPASATSREPAGATWRLPARGSDERPADVELRVTLRAGAAISEPRCPSHRVQMASFGPGSYSVSLAPLGASASIPNRDFVLTYRPLATEVRPLILLERPLGAPGVFLLSLTPPAEIAPAETRPRDVVFLVDRSCSMRGGSLAQARRAVRFVLEGLPAGDRFTVIAFDHERASPPPGSGGDVGDRGAVSALAANDPPAIVRADRFLSEVTPRGGTELEPALEAAAKLLPGDPGRTAIVVLVTDAAVGNEGRVLRRAKEILGGARLYVLGVGPAVNRYLVERLARTCGGAADVVLPHEDIEPALARFRRRILQGGPVLTGLALDWPDAGALDVYPHPLPDLFGGQPAQILGRFTGKGKTRLALTGTTATGAPFRQELVVDLSPDLSPEPSGEPMAVGAAPNLLRLWARSRIDARLERLRTHPEALPSIRHEITTLAIEHALASPFTSFVAVDTQLPDSLPEDPPARVPVPQSAPEGLAREPSAVERLERTSAPEGRWSPLREASPSDEDAPRIGGPADEPLAAAARYAIPIAAPAGEDDDDAPPPTVSFDRMTDSDALPTFETRAFGPARAVAPGHALRGRIASPPKGSGREALLPPPAAPPQIAASPAPPAAFAPSPLPGLALPLPAEPIISSAPSTIVPPPSVRAPAPVRAMAARPSPSAASSGPGSPPPSGPPLRPLAADPYPDELLAWAGKQSIGEIDLVFLFDETGSMGPYITEVQRHILHIIKAIQASPLCKSLRIGLVGYRDHPPQDSTFVTRGIPLTDDVESIERGVLAMSAQGGGDGPEAVTDGLVDVVRLGFRPRAARTVIWIGDAPPHGVSPHGDGFPEGCPCGAHWYTQAENCREMGVVIHAVACMPGLATYPGGEDVYRAVARASRGLYIPLSEAPKLIPLVTGLAESELDKQRVSAAIDEQLKAHRAELEPLTEDDRLERITALLTDADVRPRSLTMQGPRPALRFRPITADDVEEGLATLRREGLCDL